MASDTGRNRVWDVLAEAILACNASGEPYPPKAEEEFIDLAREVCQQTFSRRLPPEDTKDLCQMVVIKLWQGLRSFRGPYGGASLACWVRVAATRAMITLLGPGRRRTPDGWAEDEAIFDPETTLNELVLQHHEVFEAKELQAILLAALDELPGVQRRSFLLHHTQGRSFREVGRILGISEAAAKMAASRAVRTLLRVLVRYERGLEEDRGLGVGSGKRGEGQ